MCGHATLATAHVLHTTGAAERHGALRRPLRHPHRRRPHEDGTITLDFPTSPLTPVEAAGRRRRRARRASPLPSTTPAAHIGDLLVELADEKTVRGLAPDLAALRRLLRARRHRHRRRRGPRRAATTSSRAASSPTVGIDEDPVTGSAHTALAPFWSARLGRTELTGLQASARSGLVRTALRGDRTLLTGRAVTVIDGELLDPSRPCSRTRP